MEKKAKKVTQPKIFAEEATMLKAGKNIVFYGKHRIGRERVFQTEKGEKVKAICTSWWSYGSGFKSSYYIAR